MNKYRTTEPKQLEGAIEFMVDSSSSDPSFSGSIEVRCEPQHVGIRWFGQQAWMYIEWHEIIVVLANNPSEAFRVKLRELYDTTREEACNDVVTEMAVEDPKPTKLLFLPGIK